jgi:uncharacterized membrane protein
MLHTLVRSHRARWLSWLAASITFSLALLQARIYRSGNQSFHFLYWNLFLALLPFGASLALRALCERAPRVGRSFALAPLWLLWFVFWPNAPYLATDLVHLRARADVPLWVDLLLLFSFAHNGLVLAMGSLYDVERALSARSPSTRWPMRITVLSAIVAGSFAIFLGRFHRWNSWDLALRPAVVLADCFAILTNPSAHRGAWLFTVAVTAFLALAYGQFRAHARAVDPQDQPRAS